MSRGTFGFGFGFRGAGIVVCCVCVCYPACVSLSSGDMRFSFPGQARLCVCVFFFSFFRTHVGPWIFFYLDYAHFFIINFFLGGGYTYNTVHIGPNGFNYTD